MMKLCVYLVISERKRSEIITCVLCTLVVGILKYLYEYVDFFSAKNVNLGISVSSGRRINSLTIFGKDGDHVMFIRYQYRI